MGFWADFKGFNASKTAFSSAEIGNERMMRSCGNTSTVKLNSGSS